MALSGWALVFSIAVGAAAGSAPQRVAAQKPQKDEADPVARATKWIERARKPSVELAPEEVERAESLVAELRMLHVARPERRREVLLALLDLARLEPGPVPAQGTKSPQLRHRIAEAAREGFRRALDASREGDTLEWLARTVLAPGETGHNSRRNVALELLEGRREPATLLALLTAAQDVDRAVRDAALRALCGWNDEGVHALMVDWLARIEREPEWTPRYVAQRHFRAVELEPEGSAARALAAHTTSLLLKPDWRASVRALALAPALADPAIVPALIETLALWVGRRDTDQGSRRVEAAVVAELRRRSGTSIGAFPERWSQWWRARSTGALGEPAKGAAGEATKANFFGLRPQTDRVTFVIDRSGSMETPGPSGESRYREALEQLSGFVEALGPQARFRVILFESSVHIWKEKLQQATPAMLAVARSWVGGQKPAGGTNLKPAIERLMKAVSGEASDEQRLEEDTVIVLCDGATAEGSDWVAPFWEAVGWRSEVIFHCVQLGGGGNGTLEELARVSGGEFVRAP